LRWSGSTGFRLSGFAGLFYLVRFPHHWAGSARPAFVARGPISETGHEPIREFLEALEVPGIPAPPCEDIAEPALEIVHEPPEVFLGPPGNPTRVDRREVGVLAPLDQRGLRAEFEPLQVSILFPDVVRQEA